ncbi:hypothetical protein GCM10027034_36700 [Ramlibacter solisilvae]|uniref:OmpR/PhoB-type domain-containing protein n=1 Tax=Ramlibacter tataouinensis TaxID=94132 RepID=A0A127JUY4_9BURK|nr:winged helix-turn-helix domain-containing protein [Ramlibacter tataouinensis]AMO23715.1 hypothetical protein UC35_13625 [Ramlibacter tataouinensis]
MSAEIAPKDDAAGVISFPGFELDLDRGELRVDGRATALRPKTFQVLLCLARQPGRLVAKQALFDAVWPDVVVTDDSLVQCIGELRSVLGDDAQTRIRTVPRRGYMLDALPLPLPAPVGPAGAALSGAGIPPQSSRRLAGWVAAAVVLSLCAVLAGAWWWNEAPRPAAQAARAGKISIAVLPFGNLSGDPTQDFFADGITADVIAELSRLADTLVIAQDSVRAYAGAQASPQQAGRELGALYVVTGGVQRTGDAVRIQARLTSAESGAVLWAESADYGDGKPWNWRAEMGPRMGRALLTGIADAVALRAASPDEPHEAIEHTMRGYSLMRGAGSLADLEAAIAEFDKALRAGQGSASAWAGRSIALSGAILSRLVAAPEDKLRAAEEAAAKALAADLTNPNAHFAHGQVLRLRGRLREALQAFEQCTALDPSFVYAHARMAYVKVELGRPAEAMDHVQWALRLSPKDVKQWQPLFAGGMALFHLGRDEDAYAMMEKTAARNPRVGFPYMWMAAIDGLHGRDGKARENLARYMERIPLHTIHELKATELSIEPVFLAQRERFYEGLRKAGLAE